MNKSDKEKSLEDRVAEIEKQLELLKSRQLILIVSFAMLGMFFLIYIIIPK
jgi:hypothetical protein